MSKGTEAEKWLRFLRMRSNGVTSAAVMNTIMIELRSDYPHELINLAERGAVIGARRVFGDRSYCDILLADAATGNVTFGSLSKGMVGRAGNGRLILH